MISDERDTKKYKDAVELTISLERKEMYIFMTAEYIKAMEPKELYDYLESEWWRQWNGLIQEWENP